MLDRGYGPFSGYRLGDEMETCLYTTMSRFQARRVNG